MADEGFGSDLWKNLQAIKLGHDGGIEAPVTANERDGIVVGVERVAAAQAAARDAAAPAAPRRRGWWARLLRH